MTYYAPINEAIRLWVADDIPVETKGALAAFCRRNGFTHLYYETIEPMLPRAELILALATTERPWPPKGIGSQTIEAVGVAMVGSEGRTYLTPVLTDLKHATNVGLASAVTKQLLEALRERGASTAGYLVRQGDRAVERALEQSGFGRSDLQVATEYAEYLEYSAPPQRILEALGLDRMRLGDVLAFTLDGRELDRLIGYQFTLTAGVAPYLSDLIAHAPVLLGLIDLIAALPPGGVPPGTGRPDFGSGGPVV
jgi:hypothetical protein